MGTRTRSWGGEAQRGDSGQPPTQHGGSDPVKWERLERWQGQVSKALGIPRVGTRRPVLHLREMDKENGHS